MPRRAPISFAALVVAFVLLAPRAFAQPLASAAPSASDASVAPSASIAAPAPAPTSTTDDRPARGPAMRDRGAPRSRAGGTARGALFLVVLLVAAGYWVMKRVRRRF